MAYKDDKAPVTGVLGTTFGGVALAAATGLLNGGLGGLFGNQNPASSAIYQLAQKDTLIAKLESERYTDAQNKEIALEISNLKQRVAAIEVAEPLREQILGERINGVQATLARLVQPMIPNYNVSFPPPVPTFNVAPVVQNGSSSTPATTAQAA